MIFLQKINIMFVYKATLQMVFMNNVKTVVWDRLDFIKSLIVFGACIAIT